VVIQEERLHEFIGVDKRVYGPFRRGDVVCLPRVNAELLVRHGEARILEVADAGGVCPVCGREGV
jgi:DNA replication initiation complex subunit (GINS family)